MENAASALKIAAAVFIFILGLAILFTMSSQVRAVAKFFISEADQTKYYSYYKGDETTVDDNGNRIVTFDDIIPAIYRYAEENYGVTIVSKSGEIVGRFDLDTEVLCNNWLGASNSTKYKYMAEMERVYEEVNKFTPPSLGHKLVDTSTFHLDPSDLVTSSIQYDPDDPSKIISAEIKNDADEHLIEFFEKLYDQELAGGSTDSYLVRRGFYCYWAGNPGWTSQRIDSDLSRNTSIL